MTFSEYQGEWFNPIQKAAIDRFVTSFCNHYARRTFLSHVDLWWRSTEVDVELNALVAQVLTDEHLFILFSIEVEYGINRILSSRFDTRYEREVVALIELERFRPALRVPEEALLLGIIPFVDCPLISPTEHLSEFWKKMRLFRLDERGMNIMLGAEMVPLVPALSR